mmetsp:Transcript_51295/g.85085  ORF Transcript_51295/g.85085 Transcript_51295/m.85085 type:complete len:273 (+) Transcript_51295:329-1147(+)
MAIRGGHGLVPCIAGHSHAKQVPRSHAIQRHGATVGLIHHLVSTESAVVEVALLASQRHHPQRTRSLRRSVVLKRAAAVHGLHGATTTPVDVLVEDGAALAEPRLVVGKQNVGKVDIGAHRVNGAPARPQVLRKHRVREPSARALNPNGTAAFVFVVDIFLIGYEAILLVVVKLAFVNRGKVFMVHKKSTAGLGGEIVAKRTADDRQCVEAIGDKNSTAAKLSTVRIAQGFGQAIRAAVLKVHILDVESTFGTHDHAAAIVQYPIFAWIANL